jgi:hypothetical protein
MTTAHSNLASRTSLGDRFGWLGATIAFAAIVCLATTTYDPFPAFSGDPTTVEAPVLGLTPFRALVAHALCTIGAALVLIAAAVRDRAAGGASTRGHWAACGLALAGLCPLAFHTLAHDDPALTVTATAWASALALGLAAWRTSTAPHLRLALASGVLALLVAFAAKSLLQVAIEQPMAEAAFRRTRTAFLAAQGWDEGSPNALAYERRIVQREATAWFGMANVLASFAAAILAVATTLLFTRLLQSRAAPSTSPRPDRTRLALGVVALAALTAAALVVLAGSKGGYVAAALGVVLAALGALRSTRAASVGDAVSKAAPRPAALLRVASIALGPALIAAPLLLVVARGLVGERLGELSILFRWFYLQGAARAFAESPILGTSPTGFRDAYLRLKPPLSPEDVAMPHSVLADLASTLGVGGLALGALLVLAAWSAGRVLLTVSAHAAATHATHDQHPDGDTPLPRLVARFAFVALSAGTLAAIAFESRAQTPEAALVRVGAILLGTFLAWAVATLVASHPRGMLALRAGLAAAALTILAHTQIELTGTMVGACTLFALIVGLGAGSSRGTHPTPAPRSRPNIAHALVAAAPASIACIALAIVLVRAPLVHTWERSVLAAAGHVAPLPRWNAALDRVNDALRRRDRAEVERSATQLASELAAEPVPTYPGAPPGADDGTLASLVRAVQRARLARMDRAGVALDRARLAAQDHVETGRALSGLYLRGALEARDVGDSDAAGAWARRALETAATVAARADRSSLAWSWDATVCRSLIQANASAAPPADAPWLPAETDALADREIRSLERAAALAPFEPSHAFWRAQAAARAGDTAQAAAWAARALALNDALRLDPLRQFDPERVKVLRTLAAQGRSDAR